MASPKKPSKPPAPKQVVTDSPAQSDWDRAQSYRRIKDVGGARAIYNRFITDNVLRSNTIANTRNQLEGGLPFDPAELEAMGSAWQTNVNFGDSQAARDRDFLPYWKMINDVPHRAVFDIDSNAPDSDKWEVAHSEVFDEFHEDWAAGYFQEFMKFAKNFVDFGPGIAQWQDPDCPRYKSVNVQRVYWPKNTQMNPESWEVMALVRDMGASELYNLIRTPDKTRQSKAAGWNENAVKAAIVQMGEGGNGQFPDYRDYTRYQDLLVNNDIVITTPFQPLTVVWLYVKNFDGKIGCYVFPQNQGVNDFLFEDDANADDWRHLLGAVWYDTGTDGMIHSIKGFGIKNFFFSALLNRMKSRVVDGGTIASGMNFQYEGDNVPDESPPVENYGPFTIFPTNIKQLPVYPQLQPAVSVIEMLSQNQEQNNSLYNEQKQQIEETDTATQAKILASMQGQLSEAQAAIFLSQIGSNIYTEQIRRLRKKGSRDPDAKKYVERLRARNVPDEVIFDMPIRVKTGANAAMANPVMMAQKYQQGLALGNMPGVNLQWFLRNFIAYTYGSQAVDKALLPVGQDSEPQQRRQAQMENVDFGQGVMLQVAPEDAHFEHIQEHLQPLAGIVQQYNQKKQITPEQLAALTIGTEHTGQHMELLAKDETKKQQLASVTAPFRMIQSTARGILQRMQQNQQQGGAQGQQAPQGGQPQASPGGGTPKESISIAYKDAPPDIQRQMEAAAGFKPSQMATAPEKTQ